jgi:endoglucanase
VADASAIGATVVVDLLLAVAEERGIPWQWHVSDRGGTDAGAMQLAGEGALTACVSVPTRYVHSSVESCHPDDVEAAIALVAGFVERAGELAP